MVTKSSVIGATASVAVLPLALMAGLQSSATTYKAGPAHLAAAAAPKLSHRNSEQPMLGQEQALAGGVAVAAAPTPTGRGFFVAWSNGRVTVAGDARFYGDVSNVRLAAPVVGIAATSDGAGYWLLGADGGVFSFGDAAFHGSTGGIRLTSPALEMISTSNSGGYNFVAGDGGVFSFGDARFFGSTGNVHLTSPVVGMAPTPTGHGYWLVASDGGVFSFGDASFHGSTGGVRLDAPVVGLAPTRTGNGSWLLASDGGVFSFGDASYRGSGYGRTGGSPAVGIIADSTGKGYWIVLADGQVLSNGDAGSVTGTQQASSPPAGSWNFEVVNGAGQPVRWNPCEAITYAVVPNGAPAGWQNDVTNAVEQASAATGIGFIDAGTFGSTGSVPGGVGITIQWTPTLSGSGGDTVGLTNYWFYNVAGYTPQIVSANISVLSSLPSGNGPGGEQPVLLHELGHALGLAHTADDDVMNAMDLGFTSYQDGDLTGLADVGRGQGCVGFYK